MASRGSKLGGMSSPNSKKTPTKPEQTVKLDQKPKPTIKKSVLSKTSSDNKPSEPQTILEPGVKKSELHGKLIHIPPQDLPREPLFMCHQGYDPSEMMSIQK